MTTKGKKLTRDELAGMYGVSRSTLQLAIKAGVDPYDATAVTTYFRNRDKPGKPVDEATDLSEGKLRKINLDCELLQIRIDRERGVLIERDTHESIMLKLGLHSRTAWDRMPDELPPQLEGLTAAQMKAKLLDYKHARQVDLSEGLGLEDDQ